MLPPSNTASHAAEVPGSADNGQQRPSPVRKIARKPVYKRSGKRPPAAIFCQVEGCGRDLAEEKDYYRRYKVCQAHASDPCVVVRGVQSRFCQQCGTFHAVSEFDLDKRSCRHALSLHNIKRRKRAPEGGAASGQGSGGGTTQRRRQNASQSAAAADSGRAGAMGQQEPDTNSDQAHLDAAARFEAVAAALRRGEGVPGLLPQAPGGPGAYSHVSLASTSLPPRWRVPSGLERRSGSSGGSGEAAAALFRSASDEPSDAARAAAAAAIAAGYLPASVLPPGFGGSGGGGDAHPPGRLLTSSAPHANMTDMLAEFAGGELGSAQQAAAAAAAGGSAPNASLLRVLSSPAIANMTVSDYHALAAAALAAHNQQQAAQQQEQAAAAAAEQGATAADGSPRGGATRRASGEQQRKRDSPPASAAAAPPPRPAPTVMMELTEEEAELVRGHRARHIGTRALSDVANSLQLLSGGGSGEAAPGSGGGNGGGGTEGGSLRRSSAFQPYGGRGTPPPASSAAAGLAVGAAAAAGQWPLDVLQLGLARAAAVRNDPNAVQTLAEALRRSGQAAAGSDLWHTALMQPQAQSAAPSPGK